jgi:F0F1-type ATP synthase delta subunit
MEKLYAQVVEKLSKEGNTTVVESLIAHLQSRGRTKLLPKILQTLKHRASQAVHTARLEVASEGEKTHALQEAKALGLTPEHVMVNHALIRGWRAWSKDQLVDRSGKRALIDLYQNIVR